MGRGKSILTTKEGPPDSTPSSPPGALGQGRRSEGCTMPPPNPVTPLQSPNKTPQTVRVRKLRSLPCSARGGRRVPRSLQTFAFYIETQSLKIPISLLETITSENPGKREVGDGTISKRVPGRAHLETATSCATSFHLPLFPGFGAACVGLLAAPNK